MCTYGERFWWLVKTQGGRQHGRADGKAGAAGIAALASRASGGVSPAFSAQTLRLLLDHQNLVVAEVTKQGVVRICRTGGEEGVRGCRHERMDRISKMDNNKRKILRESR